MKQRQPTSIEDAVMRIVSALGRAEAAATVGKSETVVYAWADPDNDRKANVFDCLKLDAAYQAAGHGAAPILAAYRQVLRHLSDPEHRPAPLQDRCLEMVAEVGDVAAAIQAALSPTGPAGSTVTKSEAAAILREISEASAVLDALRRDVMALAEIKLAAV